MTERQDPLATLQGHVVICNCNEKVRRIVAELQASAVTDAPAVVLLVQDLALWKAHPDWHPGDRHSSRFFTVVGCPTDAELLDRARISAARAAVILADPRHGALADARSTLVAIAIERQNPQVHTVMELISSVNRVHLHATEVNEVVCLGEITEKLIAQSCITPGIKNVFDHLLSTADGAGEVFVCPLPPQLAGRTYRELARRCITAGVPFLPCGFVLQAPAEPEEPPAPREPGCAPRRPQRRLVLNPRSYTEPGKETRLQTGDALIALARREPELQLLLEASVKDG